RATSVGFERNATMNRLSPVRILVAASAIAIAYASPSAAQSSITINDILRLQDQVYETSTDISRLRGRSSDEASRLQSELDDVRDEVVYLKVKLRKEGVVSRSDYADVRDHLQDLRARARGESPSTRQGSWGGGGYSGGGSGAGSGYGSSSG